MKYYYYIPIAGSLMLIFDLLEYFIEFKYGVLRLDVFLSVICVQTIEITFLYLIFSKLLSI